MREHQLFINGEFQKSSTKQNILDPSTGEVIAVSHQATPAQVAQAIEASAAAFEKMRQVSRYTRSRLLLAIALEISKRRGEWIDLIVREAGKPYSLSDIEVGRAIQTFTWAAEETKRFVGELVPFDVDNGGRAYSTGEARWFARGPVLAIAPFNFPLNLVAHKVAPALAAGCSVLLKPPPQAPGPSMLLAEIFTHALNSIKDDARANDVIPVQALQVIHASNENLKPCLTDSRLNTLSFTGSDKVGWALQGLAVRKKVVLELGGNAAAIVAEDADLERAAKRCALNSFAYAGQTCISVQRIFVHAKVYDTFLKMLITESEKMKCGNPQDKDVTVGPMIDSGAADRVMSWVEEARNDGAKVVLEGKRQNNFVAPIIVTGVKPHHHLWKDEVFGPVVIVEKCRTFEEGLTFTNDSRFGLQAGVFTNDAKKIEQAFTVLDVGGVIINDVPSVRSDHMPYGGVKDSGLGREGLRYAMEDFSERKILIRFQG